MLLPAVTNRETWDQAFYLYDREVGSSEYIDLTGAVVTITLSARRSNNCDYGDSNYQPTPALTGSSVTGEIIFPENGTFQLNFTPAQMSALRAKTYDVGIRLTANDITRELFLGTLPILEGIDTQ